MHSCLCPSSMLLTKNLSTPLLIWSIFPINPYFPVLVTDVIVELVPAYYLLIISPFSAHIFLSMSNMKASLFESKPSPRPLSSSYYLYDFLFIPFTLSSIVSIILSAILVYVTLVLSKQSRQLVLITPLYSYTILPVCLSSTKYRNFLTNISSILVIKSFNLWKF